MGIKYLVFLGIADIWFQDASFSMFSSYMNAFWRSDRNMLNRSSPGAGKAGIGKQLVNTNCSVPISGIRYQRFYNSKAHWYLTRKNLEYTGIALLFANEELA